MNIISRSEQGEQVIQLMELMAHREGVIKPIEILNKTKFIRDDKARILLEKFAVDLAKSRCTDPSGWYKEYFKLATSGRFQPVA